MTKLYLVRGGEEEERTMWNLEDCSDTGLVLVDIRNGIIKFNYTEDTEDTKLLIRKEPIKGEAHELQT